MLSAVKAAVRVQQPPTLFGYRVGEGWTDTDRMLVLALQLYEESLCRCGYPWWMGHNEDHIGEDLFERDFGHCLICEKVEQPTKDDDVLPGDRMKVINRMYSRSVPKRWRIPEPPPPNPPRPVPAAAPAALVTDEPRSMWLKPRPPEPPAPVAVTHSRSHPRT